MAGGGNLCRAMQVFLHPQKDLQDMIQNPSFTDSLTHATEVSLGFGFLHFRVVALRNSCPSAYEA